MYKEQIWSDYKYEHLIFLQCLKKKNIRYFNPFRLTDPFRRWHIHIFRIPSFSMHFFPSPLPSAILAQKLPSLHSTQFADHHTRCPNLFKGEGYILISCIHIKLQHMKNSRPYFFCSSGELSLGYDIRLGSRLDRLCVCINQSVFNF